MSNFEKANETIYRVLNPQYGDFAVPTDAVQALADAGLLAPDLPEPNHSRRTRREWQLYPGATTGVIARVSAGCVWLYVNKQDLRTDEARTLAYALLAAADHAEKGN